MICIPTWVCGAMIGFSVYAISRLLFELLWLLEHARR